MKYDISALGNALVDTQYMVNHDFLSDIGLEPDSMTLASPEEHAPIIKKLEEMGSESVSDCGGSATNSLVAASNYGSKCHHVCRVAEDTDGKKYLDSLQKAGVEHIGYSKENSDLPTGKCLIFVTPDAKRTMSSMLGISAYLGSKDINYDAVENSKIFYIEGYMVTSDENFSAVTSVLKHLKDKNTIKALSLSDAGIVHGFREKFNVIESYGIDMIFCNDDEAIAFSGKDTLEEAIEFYKKQSYLMAITRGGDGSVVIKDGELTSSPAESISPLDTNGAGDMYAGSFMHAYLQGNNIQDCASFSNYASSKVVETFGPRLSSDGYKKVSTKKVSIKKPAKASKPVAKKKISPKAKATLANNKSKIAPYKLRKNEKYMSARMKKHFIAVLLLWKEHLKEEMQKTFDHLKTKGETYADPVDRASQEEEFAFELRTRDRERKLINKIAISIELIKQDEYGWCESCGDEIGIKRLEARPTATHCIDCKTLDEIKEKQLSG